MDVKKVALLTGALAIAAGSAVLARNMFAETSPPPEAIASAPAAVTGPEILVATKPLPIGTIIDPESFRYQPWPKELVQDAYYLRGEADPAAMAGTVVRFEITAGQPITKGALVKPGDRGFLAAALGPGMRAVTVSVSTQSGVAGFVFPGDRVDLMLTQDVAGGGDGPPLKATETIIRNLRVLATDQRTSSTGEDGNTSVQTFSTVTMEATPRIAEKIQVAQSIGALSLSLRSIADNNAELERAIASGEVVVPQTDDPKAEKQMLLAIASRPIDTDSSFVTGADVSRYQRSTVPAKQPAGPQMASAGAAPVAPPSGGEVQVGPVVKVARGTNVTAVPVGGK
jgi:pilus assembly protein CpaB